MRWLAHFIYFKILGWQILGNKNFSQGTIKKCVIIGAPHTSWLDFIIGLLLRKITGLNANFIAKKELFVGPLGWYLRSVGGSPLDRTPGQNKVQAITDLFQKSDEFRLALSPEGTRRKVDKWKTGFYYIAKSANVPIIMFTLDYGKKQNKISEPFYPTDNIERDFAHMHSFFEGATGKIAHFT